MSRQRRHKGPPRRKGGGSGGPKHGHGGDGGRGQARPSGGRRPDRPGPRQEPGSADRAQPAEVPSFLREAVATTRRQLADWLRQPSTPVAKPPNTGSVGKTDLDPWQQQAFEALVEGHSVVVDAPTTAGKTRVVEAFFRANIDNPGFRGAYTTPVKSLSNDKLREFRAMFGSEKVGIATGDIKENLGAPIVVATLESYRNSLLGVEPDLGRNVVVFDEYHYLQDESRGSAWEEAIILTPKTCQILMLSASVANADQFCDWLQRLRDDRRAVVVRTLERPVPLTDLVWVSGHWLLRSELPGGIFKRLDRQFIDRPIRQQDLAGRLAGLGDLGLTPCIIYAGRRLACQTMAAILARSLPPLPEDEAARIGEVLQQAHEECRALAFIAPDLRRMLQVYGVGYHHSGLAAPARIAIETLVKNGLLRYCVATMGLSLGINFSVRSALISDYSRPGELGFQDYGPSEVLQMLGRAGRRGRDTVGFSLWPTPESYVRLGNAQREAVESRLRTDPTTFLGLVGRGFSLRAIEHFYEQSLQRFQNPRINLSLFTGSRLARRLGVTEQALPCVTPTGAIAAFWREEPASPCHACQLRRKCHPMLESGIESPLAALHVHLHQIGALDNQEGLTAYGGVARYFPQSGGLLMARMFADGRLHRENLAAAAELAGAMALARFKEPGADPRYELPFSPDTIEEELEQLYPHELFEELYDQPQGKRAWPSLREFNPAGGFIVRSWIQGMPWRELIDTVTTEYFGTGDAMSLLYRTGTYLQSISQAGIKDCAPLARTLRDVLLREPLSLAISI